jgi:hypothetical protein
LSESTSCSATGPRPKMPMIPHMRLKTPASKKLERPRMS